MREARRSGLARLGIAAGFPSDNGVRPIGHRGLIAFGLEVDEALRLGAIAGCAPCRGSACC
jgi:hypothetical protein